MSSTKIVQTSTDQHFWICQDTGLRQIAANQIDFLYCGFLTTTSRKNKWGTITMSFTKIVLTSTDQHFWICEDTGLRQIAANQNLKSVHTDFCTHFVRLTGQLSRYFCPKPSLRRRMGCSHAWVHKWVGRSELCSAWWFSKHPGLEATSCLRYTEMSFAYAAVIAPSVWERKSRFPKNYFLFLVLFKVCAH